VLTGLVAACMFVALLLVPDGLAHAATPAAVTPAARRGTWRWPLRGRVVGRFRLTPRAPYARGQRRGIDVAAPPGSEVRAACAGRVTFTGALPRLGLAVSVRCGALVATYLRLARVAVRRGAAVWPGLRLGTLGPAGLLRLGARRAADRRGYVDPLTLLRDAGPSPPALGPAPRGRRPRGSRPLRPAPRLAPLRPAPRPLPPPAHAEPHRLPWPAYPALALIATALPVGGLMHRRRRRSRVSVAPRVSTPSASR
jgi:murein DD-endopeptidase MepM/ murein hydrolase activator NlpD